MSSADLASWLLEQIAEDEKMARGYERVAVNSLIDYSDENGPYWLVISATRVLAECEAKRRIIETQGHDWVIVRDGDTLTFGPSLVLRLLALPYADRPGYQEAWRP